MRFRLPLWAEIALTVLLALAVSNVSTIWLFRNSVDSQFARLGTDVLNQRVVTVANLVLRAPQGVQGELAKSLSSPGLLLTLDAAPAVGDRMARDVAAEIAIGSQLTTTMPETVRAQVLRADVRGTADSMIVSVAARSNLWLNIRSERQMLRPPILPVAWTAVTGLLALILASLWMARRVTQPLQKLASAAALLRRGENNGPLAETGPAPVREAARAFNTMSSRVMTMLKSQRAMMAAVAHDLRTPIAVLRFRTELVQDEDTRARLNETLNEMQGMTEAVLDAVRFDGTGEAARPVDVATLADSLCVDMAEMGGAVTYGGEAVLICTCRAAEIRRAVRNLIENALRYGMSALVSGEARDGVASIHVDDEGPGIPACDLERVFEPFARLEASRSKDTGGYGLGLSIARLIARGHGGEVTLENRSNGGLRATMKLPLD